MLNKFLLIALGGSAEKLARYVNRDVERRLRAAGWQEPVPAAWRWLCVDIAQRSDVTSGGDVPKRLGTTGTRLGLAAAPYEYADYLQKVTSRAHMLPALAGCVADANLPVPPPYKGAGQRPQIGYTIGLSEIGRLSREIHRQLLALDTQAATQQLTRLSHTLRPHCEGEPLGVTVIVASSLGGGSGASLVQTVVELLLGSATLGAQFLRPELSTLLFTPDIFVDLSPLERDGVQSNSLHTIASMLNGYEWNEPLPEEVASIVEGGGATLRDGRRAAVTNFYVGGRNAELAYNHQNKVIKATATALGRVLTDEDVTGGLAAHLETNRNGAPVLPEFRIVEPMATSRPASSLGYASVSLGNDTLEQYAAERLARAQLETFQRGHLRYHRDNERETDTIENLARDHLPEVLAQAELDREHLLARLFPQEHVKDATAQVTAAVRGHFRNKANSATPGAVEQQFEAHREAYRAARERERNDAAKAWSAHAGRALLEETTRVIGRHGAPTARELLRKVGSHLRDVVRKLELAERRVRDRKTAKGFRYETQSRLQMFGERFRRGTGITTPTTYSVQAELLIEEARAAAYALAKELASGFDEAVVTPLQSAVDAGAAQLTESEIRHDRKLVDSWSTHAVPPRLHPPLNALLLDPIETIPDLFARLLIRTAGQNDEAIDDALEEAVAELLTDSWRPGRDVEPDPQEEQADRVPGPISTISTWRPDGGSTASYTLEIDARKLLADARRWVHRRRGALSERLRLPLRAWIDQQPQNADLFADMLDQAMRCAAPLVSVNPSVHLRVHGAEPEQPKLYLSPLPIRDDHRIRSRVEQSLHDAGVDDGRIGELFDPTSPTGIIEISGFLAQPVHPVVLDSMFVPIQRDWQARTNESMRRQFAAYRRTRPLRLFVPLSPRRQRAFVNGWIVADLLGQLDRLEQPWSVRPLTVWTPQGRRGFPQHLLCGEVEEQHEALASVLESLPLAMTSFAAQHYEELEAYMRILDLGELSALRRWIATGQLEQADPGVPPPPKPRIEAPVLGVGLSPAAQAAEDAALEAAAATPADDAGNAKPGAGDDDASDPRAAGPSANGAPAPDAELPEADAEIDDAEMRRSTVLRHAKDFAAVYTQQREELPATRANLRTLPRSWEIGELVPEAVAELRLALGEVSEPDDPLAGVVAHR